MKRISIYGLMFLLAVVFEGQVLLAAEDAAAAAAFRAANEAAVEKLVAKNRGPVTPSTSDAATEVNRGVAGKLKSLLESSDAKKRKAAEEEKSGISASPSLRETLSPLTSIARKLTSSSKETEEAKVKPLPAGTQEADRKLVKKIKERIDTAAQITAQSFDEVFAKFTAETEAKILKLQNDFKELESMTPDPVVNQLKTNTQSLIDLYRQLIEEKNKFTESYKQWAGYKFQLNEVKQLKKDPAVYERIESNLATEEGLTVVIGVFDRALQEENKTISDINVKINYISSSNDLIKRKSVNTASPIVFRSEVSPIPLSALHNSISQLIDNIKERITGLNQFIKDWNERLQQAPATLENADYRKQVEILLNAANTYQRKLQEASTRLEPHQKDVALGKTKISSEQAIVIAEIPKTMDLWEKELKKDAEQANKLAARKAVPVLPFEAQPPILTPSDLLPGLSPAAKPAEREAPLKISGAGRAVLPDLSTALLETPADIKKVRDVTVEEQANVAKTSQELVQEDKKMSPLTILSGAQQNYRRHVKLARNSAADYQKTLQELNNELSALSVAREDLKKPETTVVQKEVLKKGATRREQEIRAQQDTLSQAQQKFAEGKENYLKARQAVEKEAREVKPVAPSVAVPVPASPTPVWRTGERLPSPPPSGVSKRVIQAKPADRPPPPPPSDEFPPSPVTSPAAAAAAQPVAVSALEILKSEARTRGTEKGRPTLPLPAVKAKDPVVNPEFEKPVTVDELQGHSDALAKRSAELDSKIKSYQTELETARGQSRVSPEDLIYQNQLQAVINTAKNYKEQVDGYKSDFNVALTENQNIGAKTIPGRQIRASLSQQTTSFKNLGDTLAKQEATLKDLDQKAKASVAGQVGPQEFTLMTGLGRPALSPAADRAVLPNLSTVLLTTLDDVQKLEDVAAQEQKNVETIASELVVEDGRMAAMNRLEALSSVQQNYHQQIKLASKSASAYLGALQDLNNELTVLAGTRKTLQEDMTGMKLLTPAQKEGLEITATESEQAIRAQQNKLSLLQQKFAEGKENYLKAQRAADKDTEDAKEVKRFEIVPAAPPLATLAEQNRMEELEKEFVHVDPPVAAPATPPVLPVPAPVAVKAAAPPTATLLPIPAAAAAVQPVAALRRVTLAEQEQMKKIENEFEHVERPTFRPGIVPNLSVTPLQVVSDEQRTKIFAQLSTLKEPSITDIKNIRAVTVAEQANVEKTINALSQEISAMSSAKNLLPAQKAYYDQMRQTLVNAEPYQKVLRVLNKQLEGLDSTRQTLSGGMNDAQRALFENDAQDLESEIQRQQNTISQLQSNFANAYNALGELKTKAERAAEPVSGGTTLPAPAAAQPAESALEKLTSEERAQMEAIGKKPSTKTAAAEPTVAPRPSAVAGTEAIRVAGREKEKEGELPAAAATPAWLPGEPLPLSPGVIAAKPADLTPPPPPSGEFPSAPPSGKFKPVTVAKRAVRELKGTESAEKMVEALQTLQSNENVKPLIDITIREQNTVAGRARDINQAIENEQKVSSSVEKELGGLLKDQQTAVRDYFEQLRDMQQLLIDLNDNHTKRDTLYSDVSNNKVAGDAATTAVEGILKLDKDIERQEENIRNSAKQGGVFSNAYLHFVQANKAVDKVIKEKIGKGPVMAALEGRDISPATAIGTLSPASAPAKTGSALAALKEDLPPVLRKRSPAGAADEPPLAKPAQQPAKEQSLADPQALVAAMSPAIADLKKQLDSVGAPDAETTQLENILNLRGPDLAAAQSDADQAEAAAVNAAPGSPEVERANTTRDKVIDEQNEIVNQVSRLTELRNWFGGNWKIIVPILVALVAIPVVGVVLFETLAPADKKNSYPFMAQFIQRLVGAGVNLSTITYSGIEAAYDAVADAGYDVRIVSAQDLLRITGLVSIIPPRQQRNTIIQVHTPLKEKKRTHSANA